MAVTPLEDRMIAVENEMERLKRELAEVKPEGAARWEKVIGTFAECEGLDEAVRLGREYRDSLRPKDGEEAG